MNFQIIFAVIQSVAIVVLVIVTLWYAKTTSDILKDNQKERRIIFLQHRLEKLYAPLKNNTEILIQHHLIIHMHPKHEQYVNFTSEIKKCTYLGSKELQMNLEIFFKGLDNYIQIDRDEDKKREFHKVIDKIIALVNREYEELNERLFELAK